jgi:hypothetical protein
VSERFSPPCGHAAELDVEDVVRLLFGEAEWRPAEGSRGLVLVSARRHRFKDLWCGIDRPLDALEDLQPLVSHPTTLLIGRPRKVVARHPPSIADRKEAVHARADELPAETFTDRRWAELEELVARRLRIPRGERVHSVRFAEWLWTGAPKT